MSGWTLGIESTAHTLSFGLVDEQGNPHPSKSSIIRPVKGGIHPRKLQITIGMLDYLCLRKYWKLTNYHLTT